MTEETDPAFERLLDYVRDNRGFDFTGYKRPSLVRRFRRRMQDVGIEEFADYQDHLEVHPDEFTELFNTILINVTSFFRDPETWEYLGAEVVPPIKVELVADVPRLAAGGAGIIVAGPAQSADPLGYAETVATIAEKLGWPVLADGLSPLRHHAAMALRRRGGDSG